MKYKFLYLIVIYLAYLFFALNIFSWVIDDLYIYFRYVNNFLSGNGIVFNKGEYVEGFSSFSWFLILSLAAYLKLPLELSSKISGMIFALVILLLVFKICEKQKLEMFSFAACCMMMFSLPFILWSISGFEIMFYIFLLLITFYKIVNLNDHPVYYLFVSILIFLISISRPEGLCFSLVSIILIFFTAQNKLYTLKISAAYLFLFGSFLLFRYIYFGDLLPNTYYAKIGHNIFGYYEFRTYKNGIFYILFFFRDNPQFIIPFFLFPLIYKRIKSNKFFLFILIFISVQFIFVIFSGGDWMVDYRFMIPAIPFLSILTVVSIKEFTQVFNPGKLIFNTGILFLLLIIVLNLFLSDYTIINKETILWNNVKNVSNEIKKDISPDELTAIGSAGIIPYTLKDVTFIDMVGLTNKFVAKNGLRHGTWFEKSLPEYVYGNNPVWLIMWKRKNNSGEFTFERANPGYLDMALDKNFEKYFLYKTYEVYEGDRIELYKLKNK